MEKSAYRVEFHNKKAKIHDGDGKLIGTREKKRGNLFYLDLSEETCLFTKQENVLLWHKILCHVQFENLVNISKMNKVRGFPKLKNPDNALCK